MSRFWGNVAIPAMLVESLYLTLKELEVKDAFDLAWAFYGVEWDFHLLLPNQTRRLSGVRATRGPRFMRVHRCEILWSSADITKAATRVELCDNMRVDRAQGS